MAPTKRKNAAATGGTRDVASQSNQTTQPVENSSNARRQTEPRTLVQTAWHVVRTAITFLLLITVAYDQLIGPIQLLYYEGPGYSGRAPVRPGNISETLEVPARIPPPPWGFGNATENAKGQPKGVTEGLAIQDAAGIDAMRAAGLLASKALAFAHSMIAPGVTTDEIDKAVHTFIVDNLAYPTPLHYKNFPKSICTSVNEVMVHGIPDSRPLLEGDIINVDITVYLEGVHADTSATFKVGKVPYKAYHLIKTTEKALNAAVAACGPGKTLSDISKAIQAVADDEGLTTIRQFIGHGIGSEFHSRPRVYSFSPSGWWDLYGWVQLLSGRDQWTPLKPGQTFTIEPILLEKGGLQRISIWNDGWTAATVDGSLSAQFEYTVLVQEPGSGEGHGGCEILTPFLWKQQRPDDAEFIAEAQKLLRKVRQRFPVKH